MSRPSQNLDKVLIEVGKKMMTEGGITDLSIRQVCSRAKVNPGMFKYHFENRANFLRIVHEQLYDEFFAVLQEAADRESDPLAKLKACLVAMSRVCNEQRPLFIGLIRDHMNGKLQEILCTEDMVPKDLLLILELIGECKAHGFFPQHIADFQVASMLIPVVIMPILMESDAKEMACHFPEKILLNLGSEAACIERLDIVLKGLRS